MGDGVGRARGVAVTAPAVHGAWGLNADGGLSRTGSPLTAAQDYDRLPFEERTHLMLVQVCGNPTGAQVVTSSPISVTQFTMKPGDGGWRVDDVRELVE